MTVVAGRHSAMETIYALASAPGRAGVAVWRISGPCAGPALVALTRQALPAPRQASRRAFYGPEPDGLIDRGLALWFPAPHSFTGEDVAELQLHGGRAVAQAIGAALAMQPGLRLAEPGEFTRRAFEHDKLDLTEAEAIADLVDAETGAQLRQALRQLDGALGRLYEDWRTRLLRALAHLEASIDFADEDLPPDLAGARLAGLEGLRREIAAHLDDARRGERVRNGFYIAILGPPNAGKSSLLNLLAQRDAAIVAATAGTTRDVIEVQLDLGGYPVTVADTAGLRATTDGIESEGVRRAQAHAAQADLKLLLFEATAWPALDPLTLALRDERSLIVLNKTDLLQERFTPDRPGADVLLVSLHTGAGVPELLAQLTRRVGAELADTGSPPLTRARHRDALIRCCEHLGRAQDGLAQDREMALIAEDVRLAMRALGRITGAVDAEALLDIIFRDFCLGK